MKKIVIVLIPLFAACHSATDNVVENKVVTQTNTEQSTPVTAEDITVSASYTPKLEAKKWNGIKEMTDETFKTDILSSSTITLVDFNATWCGPCRQQKPILDKLVKEYQGVINFASVDVDVCPSTAQLYRISSIPTLAFVQNAKVGGSSVGLTPYNQLKAMIDKAIKESK